MNAIISCQLTIAYIHMSNDERKDAMIAYRVRQSLKDELQKLADADKRKLSQYIEIVLEEHVAAKKAQKRK